MRFWFGVGRPFRSAWLWLLLGVSCGAYGRDTLSRLSPVSAPTGQPVLLRMKDGSVLRGVIRSRTGDELLFQSETLGSITLNADYVAAIEPTGGFFRRGQFWFPNPHTTRYFWAPSAYGLRRGEGYYQNAYVFVNSVNYGLSDRFSLGGGFLFNPTFRGTQIFFLTPKISTPVAERVSVSAGAIVVTVVNEDPDVVGIVYGNATLGNAERNTTAGIGWGFVGADGVAASPVINLSHMSRVGRRVSFVTENWFIGLGRDGVLALLSGGIRFMNERTALDAGLIVPTARGFDTFVALPYLAFVLKFGKRNHVVDSRRP